MNIITKIAFSLVVVFKYNSYKIECFDKISNRSKYYKL